MNARIVDFITLSGNKLHHVWFESVTESTMYVCVCVCVQVRRFRDYWCKMAMNPGDAQLRDNQIGLRELRLPAVCEPLVERNLAFFKKLLNCIQLNSKVHTDRYNTIINGITKEHSSKAHIQQKLETLQIVDAGEQQQQQEGVAVALQSM